MAELSDKKLNRVRKDNLDRQTHYVGIYTNIIETIGRDSGDHDVLGYGGTEYTAVGGTFVYGHKLFQNEQVHLFGEARIARTFGMEESENVTTTLYSALLKPAYRVSRKVHLFTLFGLTYGTLDSFHTAHDYNVNGTGFALGLGGEIDFNDQLSITADGLWSALDVYSPFLGENVNVSQFNLGLNYRF